MAKLKIFKGKEFKVYVTDSIEEDDLFFGEYKKAAEMLSEIVKYNKNNDNKLEYENNIIAFCGERGEGKSSAMLSFVKAMKSYANSKKSQKVFEDFNEIGSMHFLSRLSLIHLYLMRHMVFLMLFWLKYITKLIVLRKIVKLSSQTNITRLLLNFKRYISMSF